MFRDGVVVAEKFVKHASALGPAIDGAGIHQRRKHANAGVQRRERSPARIVRRSRRLLRSSSIPSECKRRRKGARKSCGARILAPILGRDGLLMDVEIGQKARRAHPAPAHRGIHQLDESAEPAPDDDEVRDAVGQHDDGDGGQRARFIDQHVIGRQHDLLGSQSELIRDFFDGVDGGAVHAGLAGLAQAAVIDGMPKPSSSDLSAAGPQSMLEVWTTSGTMRRVLLRHRVPRVRGSKRNGRWGTRVRFRYRRKPMTKWWLVAGWLAKTSSAWSEAIDLNPGRKERMPFECTIADWPGVNAIESVGGKYAMAWPDSIRTLVVDSYCGTRAASIHQVQATSRIAAASKAEFRSSKIVGVQGAQGSSERDSLVHDQTGAGRSLSQRMKSRVGGWPPAARNRDSALAAVRLTVHHHLHHGLRERQFRAGKPRRFDRPREGRLVQACFTNANSAGCVSRKRAAKASNDSGCFNFGGHIERPFEEDRKERALNQSPCGATYGASFRHRARSGQARTASSSVASAQA